MARLTSVSVQRIPTLTVGGNCRSRCSHQFWISLLPPPSHQIRVNLLSQSSHQFRSSHLSRSSHPYLFSHPYLCSHLSLFSHPYLFSHPPLWSPNHWAFFVKYVSSCKSSLCLWYAALLTGTSEKWSVERLTVDSSIFNILLVTFMNDPHFYVCIPACISPEHFNIRRHFVKS